MSGYTILKIFCSFIVFLVLPSVGLPEEVNLKIDVHVLLISFVLNLNSGEFGLFLLASTLFVPFKYIAVSYVECSRIFSVCFYVGWHDACREKADRRN